MKRFFNNIIDTIKYMDTTILVMCIVVGLLVVGVIGLVVYCVVTGNVNTTCTESTTVVQNTFTTLYTLHMIG